MGQHEEQEPDMQLRSALKDVLATSEQQVPSTTQAIFAALRKEQPRHNGDTDTSTASAPDEIPDQDQMLAPGSLVPVVRGTPQPARRSRSRTRAPWQTIAAIAAVLIIVLASAGLLSHRLFVPLTGTSGTPGVGKTPLQSTHSAQTPGAVSSSSPASPPSGISSSTPTLTVTPAPFDGWNRVALVTPALTLANLNYLADCCTPLSSLKFPSGTIFDGISQDGQNVMYHTVNHGSTVYSVLLSAQKNVAVYTYNGNGGNAIWLNSTYALLTTFNSIIAVNVQTGAASTYLPSLMAAHLNFFHAPYLYFTGGANRSVNALYRINIDTGAIQQITFSSTGASFWLSPDGTTVYFANTIGPTGNPGLYAVNSDGTHMHLLRQYQSAVPIGYAPDNALIIMRAENGAFQVLKLGTTAGQDQLLLDDVAPGAAALCQTTNVGISPICNSYVALAPYGHALIAQGLYPDGTYKVWSDDLTTGKRMVVPSLSSIHTPVQLIGWDKIPTP